MNDTLVPRMSTRAPTPATVRQNSLHAHAPREHAATAIGTRDASEGGIMDNRQLRDVERYQRILVYLGRTPIKPAPPLLASLKEELAASVARLRELGNEQHIAAKYVRHSSVESLRQYVRQRMMMPAVRMARSYLRFAPGAEQVLRVPHARASTATVAARGHELADMMEPHVDVFASAGFGTGFVADLRERADALANAGARLDEARQRLSRTTMEVREELKNAKRIMDVMDGIFRHHSSRDDLAQWRWACRVNSRLGRPRRRGNAGVGKPALVVSESDRARR